MSSGLQLKYFVLNPYEKSRYGFASREAILTYAEFIRSTNPQLSTELEEWISRVNQERLESADDN